MLWLGFPGGIDGVCCHLQMPDVCQAGFCFQHRITRLRAATSDEVAARSCG
jgi:hypothetical protein